MEHFEQNLLMAGMHGSVVILAVILFRLIFRKTPRKYICLLWLLAGIRLLLPIEIRSDLSLQPDISVPFAGVAFGKWASAAMLFWAIIACLFLLYSVISYVKLKRQVSEAVRIRGGWECDRIETAFILGFIKPRIYIPMGMNKESRKYILEHERTHLDKGDHWIKMIGFIALALHWYNPLVWIAYILLCRDIEMACDERVIRFMELDERKAYSTALLSCSSRHARFIANPVAFGEVSVRQRILSILNYKKPSFWISLLGVVAGLLGATAYVYGYSTILALLIFQDTMLAMAAAIAVAIAVAAAVTAVLGFDETLITGEDVKAAPAAIPSTEVRELTACVNGTSIDLETVEDQVFSSKMMGDGVAFQPASEDILAPADGVICTVAETKHAVGIQLNNGVQVLIHVGIDTVAMKGNGFQTFVKEGQAVTKGQKLLHFDRKAIQEAGYKDTIMMLVVENEKELPLNKAPYGNIDGNSAVIHF